MDERKPSISIWSPDPQVHPEQAEHMKRFHDNAAWLEGVLQANGITHIDVMPPLKRADEMPMAEARELLQYEIFTQPRLTSPAATQNIVEAISDKLGLLGDVLPPMRIPGQMFDLIQGNNFHAMSNYAPSRGIPFFK